MKYTRKHTKKQRKSNFRKKKQTCKNLTKRKNRVGGMGPMSLYRYLKDKRKLIRNFNYIQGFDTNTDRFYYNFSNNNYFIKDPDQIKSENNIQDNNDSKSEIVNDTEPIGNLKDIGQIQDIYMVSIIIHDNPTSVMIIKSSINPNIIYTFTCIKPKTQMGGVHASHDKSKQVIIDVEKNNNLSSTPIQITESSMANIEKNQKINDKENKSFIDGLKNNSFIRVYNIYSLHE